MASLKRHDGQLEIDCRAGDGIPPDIARIAHLPEIRGGEDYRCATMTCDHCATVVIRNELRTRAREYCRTCDAYICDDCARVAARPGYVHRSFSDLRDMVRSGRFVIVGGPASDPILVPTFKET